MASDPREAQVYSAVQQALAEHRPFFFAWADAKGEVRYAVYNAVPAMAAQAVAAFFASYGEPASARLVPQPKDETV